MSPPPVAPQHHLCPACGHRIVTARLADGREIAIDTGLRTYRLVGDTDGTFRAEVSGSYPVHACRGGRARPSAAGVRSDC